jgi:NADP-dependent 3-hydroxy acid dehydrogenase YdfG
MKQRGIDRFSGKRVWVIGASSGIGEACANALLAQGAKVALSSRRVERLNAIAAQAQADQALVIPLDVTNDDQFHGAYQTLLNTWGGIDLLLFVSGMYIPLRADDFEIQAAEQTIGANLLGPMRAVA